MCDPPRGHPHISVCLLAGCVTDGPSEHCSLSPTPYRSPLDVTIWVFISSSPSQVVVWALMSQLPWRKSKSCCTTLGGGGWCSATESFMNPTKCRKQSQTSNPPISFSTLPRVNMWLCTPLGVNNVARWERVTTREACLNDDECSDEWSVLHWWTRTGGIEGTDVSRGLSSWQREHYVFWSQLGNDP